MVQPLHDLSKHRVFAAVQMRRARSIDDNAHVRICCGDRRISQVPKRKAIERVRFGFCIVDDQLLTSAATGAAVSVANTARHWPLRSTTMSDHSRGGAYVRPAVRRESGTKPALDPYHFATTDLA